MKNLILYTGLITIILMACSPTKDEFVPTLPPITQTGENTFGCYVDGKLLIPREGEGTFNSRDYGMIYSGFGNGPNYEHNELNIHDFKGVNKMRMDIHFVSLHENGEGIFTINKSNCEIGLDANHNINIRVRWWDEDIQAHKWYCSIEDAGTLEITRYDFENFIVSGTFSCKMANRDDPSDIIEVTEGRFDIKWDELPYTNFP